MRLTTRDIRLLKDLSLSHVLSRDQMVSLGYFGSVTRVNTRLRSLVTHGFVKRLDTPFFAQGLYMVGNAAHELVGNRISSIVASRTGSPRFLQHALCTTNLRIYLLRNGARSWRFEQQLRCSFRYQGCHVEVRPDGLAIYDDHLVPVEVDLGHVGLKKIKEKLCAYETFFASGECERQWKSPAFELLIVTSGALRASRISAIVPKSFSIQMTCIAYEKLGIPFAGAWS